MAEQAGIFLEFDVDEKGIKKMLGDEFEAKFENKLGYFFSGLLQECNFESGNVFLFNYDKGTNKCFIAWLMNHFDSESLKPFDKVLKIVSKIKHSDSVDYAIVATTYPVILFAYKISAQQVQKITPGKFPEQIALGLFNRFWSFSENNSFPLPEEALGKRNYFDKHFKSYYKRFLNHIEEVEKPKKIAVATKQKPYHLFESFYTYNQKVYEFRTFNSQILELRKADPYTLNNRSGFISDGHHVFSERLTKDSPSNEVKGRFGVTNNPKAKWEWNFLEGIDGASFQYVKERWDTVYWKDKDNVYTKRDAEVIVVTQADTETFEYLDLCFGKDKNHIYYYEKILPINVRHFKLNENGFIYDSQNIFHYQHQLKLDAPTFKVLKFESAVNPFTGTFLLEDKNGQYEYNRDWEVPQLRPFDV